jgi:radical SAM protein with 4Fe4S-binding SPASM domain
MTSAAAEYPHYVGIETINTCNARCPFCPLFQGSAQMSRTTRPAHIMDAQLFERITSQISKWDKLPQTIFLNMNGEPLQDPEFLERCRVLRRCGLGPLIQLQTNAHFLGANEAEAILDADIGRLVIGFDGASRAIYEYHRARCSYDRVLDNIKAFVKLRRERCKSTKIAIQYVRTSRNAHEIAEAWRMFGGMLDAELDCLQDDVSKDWGDSPGEEGLYILAKRSFPVEHANCQLAIQQFIINSDGKVQACCWDYNLSVSEGGLGDATVQRLVDIWRSKKRREILGRINADHVGARPEKCRTCVYSGAPAELPQPEIDIPKHLVSSAPYGHTYRFAIKSPNSRATVS